MERFTHEMRKHHGTLVIQPRGNLDSTAAFAFEKLVTKTLTEEATPVVFDCERLEFLSSSGIRILVVARHLATGGGGKLVVCNLKPHIRNVIRISGLEAVLMVVGTRMEALTACQAK